MAKTVKLADIAEKVGVSTVTVSKALSGQKGVSEEMREKIKQLADELGYRSPSENKRQTTEKQYNIGVIIQEVYLDKYDSFYLMMYQELNKRAVARGCFTLLESMSRESVLSNVMPLLVQEKKVDGLIVVGDMTQTYMEHLEEKAGIPVVCMDFYNDTINLDTVISNSFYGTYALTNYLFQMGHKKIAYVGTVGTTNSITDRYLGYAKSLLEHHIEVRKDYVIGDRDTKTGRMDLDKYYQLPEDMPSAFVCNCDLAASYLIRKLRANGYRVPEDISVVGFDNYLFPGLCDIGITTYEVNIGEMARRVVHKIVRKIANENYTAGVFIVDGHMVIKDSVTRK
jgi:DNA-binding LacI/PurR family transcriptional regulator